jgi:hypothetical protein
MAGQAILLPLPIYQVVEKVVFPQAGQKHPDARRAKS